MTLLEIKIAVALLVVAVLMLGVGLLVKHHDTKVVAELKGQYEQRDAAAATAAAARTVQLDQASAENVREGQRLASADRDASVRLATAAAGLHDRAAHAFGPGLSVHPTVTSGSAAAAAGPDLCTGLSDRLVEAAGRIASQANANRTAGLTCQRDGENLRR